MGLSGLIGAGANEGLEDLLARQLLQQQQAERERAQRAQEGIQGRRLDQDDSQHADLMGMRGRELDQRDTERRDDSNRAGVADMERQRQQMDRAAAEEALAKELEAFTADPAVPNRVKGQLRANRLGVTGTTDEDFMSPEDRAAEDARKATQIGAETEARARAEAKYRQPAGDGGGGFSLSEGQTRFDGQGNQIATVPKGGGGGGDTAYADSRNSRTREAATKLLGKVSGWNTGMGSLLGSIPATDATDFAAELDTLKANIAFNELAQMRAASKTGGALGAVSDKEMRLLESALGAINPRQSPDQFKAQLQQIVTSLDNFEAAKGLSSTPGNNASVTAPPTGGSGRVVRGPDGKLMIQR